MKIKLLSEFATMPTYGTDGAACFDIYADHSVVVPAGKSEIVSTGIAVEVPPDHAMLLLSRSGHGFNHGVRLGNCVGVIDPDYVGQVKVLLHNDSSRDYLVQVGERVAQALIVPAFRHRLELVTELSETARGTGGFGSTGLL